MKRPEDMQQSASAERGVAAVIVNFEGGECLQRCIGSLAGDRSIVEIVVVDNGSLDGSTAEAVRTFPGIKVVSPGVNLGFAGGANAGAAVAEAPLLLFLNPDVELGAGVVARLVSSMGKRVGVVAPPLDVAAAGSLEFGCTIDPLGMPVSLSAPSRPLYVPGCALMTPALLFRQLGGFDDRFFMFIEDVDYCWRVLLRGFDVCIASVLPIRHQGGFSAAGGYLTSEGVSTSRSRVALRERNTLAMLIKCYGLVVWVAVPLYILQSLGTATMLAVFGRRVTAGDILRGVSWNVVQLPATLRMRRRVQRSRAVGDHVVMKRMYLGLRKVALLLRFGVPRVSEDGPLLGE